MKDVYKHTELQSKSIRNFNMSTSLSLSIIIQRHFQKATKIAIQMWVH